MPALAKDPSLNNSDLELNTIDEILYQAFEQLGEVIPHDLATLFLLQDGELHPYMTKGPLADQRILDHKLNLKNYPNIQRSILQNEPLINHEEDHQTHGDPYDGILDLPHGHSCMVIPIQSMGKAKGVITFDRQVCEPYGLSTIQLASSYSRMMALTLDLAEQAKAIYIEKLRLGQENQLLRSESPNSHAVEMLQRCCSPRIQNILKTLAKLANSELPILIGGETGTGKEVFAQAIHDLSQRKDQPFIKLNCSALSANLIESELFGHVKGAFSGAQHARQGRFSVANHGTLLLDEVAEMPIDLQAKLLRVLQEGTFEPVGSDTTMNTDVRVIAASHVNLQEAVQQGKFREDLYYRLNVIPIACPPLRERIEDIEVIARGVLQTVQRRRGKMTTLSSAALQQLISYSWPGNIRELVNVLERAQVLADSEILPEHLNISEPEKSSSHESTGMIDSAEQIISLKNMERQHIVKALIHCHHKISGPDGAANLLGLKPTTLRSRMEKLELL
jgi:transcriptional regulator with GAF, ATPase, and Fis domain